MRPTRYVTRGGEAHRTGNAEAGVTVTWRIPAEDHADYEGRKREVTSRVTLVGQPGQQASILDTYPEPNRYSLMVRHPGPNSLFVAVHEAYHDRPLVAGLQEIPMGPGRGFEVRHANGGKRIILLGAGSGKGGLRTDAQLALLELNASGQLVSAGILRGTVLTYGGLRLTAKTETCLSVTFGEDGPVIAASPPVATRTVRGRTVGGKPIRAAERVPFEMVVPARFSPTGQAVTEAGLTDPDWYQRPGEDRRSRDPED